MASRWKRYGEGRSYLIGSSIGALAILWSVLVAQDHAENAAPAPLVPASASSTSPIDSQPKAAPVVHTRTRAS
jgi:hypothetical protein